MRKLLYLWMFSMLVSASGVQAATFTVDNNGDIDNALGYVAADGTNTLRKCIRLANATAVLDTVLFNIPGPPYLITAATALIITRPVYIDGLSQPGAAPGNLIIELNGTNAVSNGALQLSGVNSSGSTIRGLVIYGSERGIYVNVSNNTTIICSHIGTNAGGTARIATPDTLLHGIYIINSQNTIIGGTGGIAERNIISGCGQNGIRIGTTSTGTVIMGNYIGTDITGTALIPNNQVTGGPYAGIFCATGSNNTTIGGPTSNYRNLISGNKQRGIYLQTSVSCLIRNNYIGTGISGNSSIPNINNGIETTTTCTGVMVLDNVISSNGQDGVKISASDNAVVKGNKIGLGSDGITQLGNGNHGLEILNSLSATIGSSIAAERNYISKNAVSGIRVNNGDLTIIRGNYIGTDNSGTIDYGNIQQGIHLSNNSDNCTIGGPNPGDGNLVSGNDQRGIYIQTSINCKVQGNFIGTDISGNSALGNTLSGIESGTVSTNLQILDNIISSNGNRGIYLNGSVDRAIIKGNKIGLGLNGTAALGNAANGLEILNSFRPVIGGSLLTERNYIAKNLNSGIRIINGDSALIQGNYIGTDITGTLDYGNTQQGIFISNNSDNCIIGGTMPGEGNLISGNDQRGIYLQASLYPKIQNNLVGTTLTGNAALGNTTIGIEIGSFGGVGFTGVQITNNVISSNGDRGIYLNSSGTTDRAIIKGNKVGLGSDGTTPLGNTNTGLEILNSFKPVIGSGLVPDRNYIAKNGGSGIRISNGDSALIQGNYIGTDLTGTQDYGNAQQGLWIANADSCLIGGSSAADGNLISGNDQRGLYIQTSAYCRAESNFIGTDLSGNTSLGNTTMGMEVTSTSPYIQILNNVISSNGQNGIRISTSNRPVIKGNKIGVGLNGTTQMGNQNFGVEILNSFKPLVGSSLAADRNLISNNGYNYNLPAPANRYHGLRIDNGDSAIVQGNYIGVDVTGLLDYGNAQAGISLKASDHVIVGGSNAGEGNLISGNGLEGIALNKDLQDTTLVVTIKGNIIGLDRNLSAAIPNDGSGVDLYNCASSLIGGALLSERNYISSNGVNGLQLTNCGASVIKGNYFGVDGTGLLNRGNNNVTIRVDRSRGVIIGGGSPGERNLINGSKTLHGIFLTGGSAKCIIKGNFVGVAADGKTDIGNWQHGIFVVNHSDSTIIGGSAFMERNVCSWNGKTQVAGDGIRIEGGSIPNTIYGNVILGNYCGVDSSGKSECPNIWAGISLNEAADNIVGGSGADEGNICSSNGNEGMYFRNALRNKIFGNYIGTDKTGTLQMGNDDWALNFSVAGANIDNIIGGSPANANIIAYNDNINGQGPGLTISSISYRNLITFNKIYCNAGIGIMIAGGGNEGVPAPVIVNSNPNDVNGTGIDGYTIHAYMNSTVDAGSKCDCEGETYIGSAIVSGGVWSITHNLGLSAAASLSVTATQTNPTDPSGNSFPTSSTSQFSSCNAPLPVTLVSFEVSRSGDQALLEWATSSELNNKEFEIEKSTDGIHFISIGTIAGHGNSQTPQNYTYLDPVSTETSGIVYYRIKQIDVNGKYTYSVTRSLSLGKNEILVNVLENKELVLETFLADQTEFSMVLYTVHGQIVYSGKTSVGKGHSRKYFYFSELPSAMYLIQIYSKDQLLTKKLELF